MTHDYQATARFEERAATTEEWDDDAHGPDEDKQRLRRQSQVVRVERRVALIREVQPKSHGEEKAAAELWKKEEKRWDGVEAIKRSSTAFKTIKLNWHHYGDHLYKQIGAALVCVSDLTHNAERWTMISACLYEHKYDGVNSN